MPTAIPAVPATAADIVVVVTIPIALPCMYCAIFFAFGIVNVFLILARTGVTVAVIVFEPATVTTIPVASTVVVTIVTDFVTSPCQHFACLTTFVFFFVPAGTRLAVCKRQRRQFFVGFDTTVTTVPIATTFVIAIVTIPVTFPSVNITPRHAGMVTCEIGVVARAIVTVVIIAFAPTAVSAIPTASTIVVIVVAIAVASEMIDRTRPFTILARILARAVFTIFVSFVSTAAVAVIPAALANIISVVTIFVALPHFDARLIVGFEKIAIFG